MKFNQDEFENMFKDKEQRNQFLNFLLEISADGENVFEIAKQCNLIEDNVRTFMEYTHSNIKEMEKDNEKRARMIEFLKGINNLCGEFIKAENLK